MVRATNPTPPTVGLPYNPTTDGGRGLLPPLLRAMTHPLLLWEMLTKSIPLTTERASAELNEAKTHIDDTAPGLIDALSSDGYTAYTVWRNVLDEAIGTATAASTVAPDADTEANAPALKTAIKAIATQTWALAAALDVELFGLPDATDAGKLP